MEKQNSEALFSNAAMHKILDAAIDAICVLDKQYKIVFWNKSAEKITGYSKSDVQKIKDFRKLNWTKNQENSSVEITDKIKESINTQIATNIITQLDNTNIEESVTVNVLLTPIYIDNKIFTVVAFRNHFEDINHDSNPFPPKQHKTRELPSDELMHKDEKLRDMTIMFVDISGFTSISEKMTPSDTALLLNDFYQICVKFTNRNHGEIDKFIGDAVMSNFLYADDAILSAKQILKEIHLYNKTRKKMDLPRINLHIGINSGTVIQVEIRSESTIDSTVIGDPVNTASRIESISIPNTIMISEPTYSRLSDKSKFEFFGYKKLKGKTNPIRIYGYKPRF